MYSDGLGHIQINGTYSSGKYCRAPLLYAGAIFDAFRRISLTVASVSPAPRFHLGACMKSSEGAGPGIRSEVGASFGRLSHVLVASGLGFAPRRGFAGPMPNRFLACCSDLAARSLASCFFRYSDFTALKLVIAMEPLKRLAAQA